MTNPTPDPVDPFLFFDCYRGDGVDPAKLPALLTDRRFVGCIIKATQGDYYSPDWFAPMWKVIRSLALTRAMNLAEDGTHFLRGAYHFLDFSIGGARQADYYLAAIDKAGGWDANDIIPIMDVERGQDSSRNHGAIASKVVDVASAFAARITDVTKRPVMLYGRGAMLDLGITSKLGCSIAWNPSYTAAMRPMDAAGWHLDEIALWQYAGDGVGEGASKGLPNSVPAFGPHGDISVAITGADKPTWPIVRSRLLTGVP